MPIIEIQSLDHPGAEIFSSMTDAQLHNRQDPELGIFITESPKVIRADLDLDISRKPYSVKPNTSPAMPPTSFAGAEKFPYIPAHANSYLISRNTDPRSVLRHATQTSPLIEETCKDSLPIAVT